MTKWYLSLKKRVLDVVFPISCLNCGKASSPRRSLGGGGWLCEDCLSFVEFRPVFLCPACGKNSYLGRVCQRCADKSYLDGLIAMDKYSNPLMKNLIKSLKFQYITDLGPVLNRLVRKFCLKYSEVFPSVAILVPVPLHPLRFRQREFNQAEFISKFVSAALGYEISEVLKRVRYTYRQSELPEEMKKDNIRGAFQYICQDDNPVPEIVILVDDVYTSGFTMQECAKVLKAAGVREVWGFTLARG